MSRRDEEILAVIIGRAGSKGLPGKNARILAGRPMVCHTVEHALAATSVDRVIVSTDGEEIAAAARAMGVEVSMRPAHLSDDRATVDSAVRHAVETCGSLAEIVVILYANVPIRPDGIVDRAIATLRSTGSDSVQSYERPGKYHPFWMVTLGAAGEVRQWQSNAVYRRQDLPPCHMPDGGVIVVRRASLFNVVEGQPHAFLGSDRRGIENPHGAVVDVDTMLDFTVAEAMLAQRAQGVNS
ncbi:MAG: acylneuraminate cytidylyltransferase family protein [Phycisphaerae bacterium]|nr:acylneuraminate cytidylyltransferase family protein [Phycisphaerae bacterium]